MPLTPGCILYVEGKPAAVSCSLEGARNLAALYIHKRQALKLENCVASLPTQVWVYDYAIAAWVLQRHMAKDNRATDRIAAAGIPPTGGAETAPTLGGASNAGLRAHADFDPTEVRGIAGNGEYEG